MLHKNQCQSGKTSTNRGKRLSNRTIALSPNNRKYSQSNGLCFKKTQKTKPLKKIPETDTIFENVLAAKRSSQENQKSLRISIDSKAKVRIGEFSREGYHRNGQPLKALDHDYAPESLLVPFGILDVLKDQLWIYFGKSKETSDFIVDCLEMWWRENSPIYGEIEELMIELDGGSPIRSNRTQFIKRMVEFCQWSQLKIRLVYYPPYHSKYNTIERCWACLENFWNGAILDSVEKTIEWAKNMTWKGVKPIVKIVEQTYEKGIKPSSTELAECQKFWHPSEKLPSWDVTIIPTG